MYTYNNFNELATGQTTLHSDMSVFNAASPEQMKSLESTIADAKASIRRAYDETDFGNMEGLDANVRKTLNDLHTLCIALGGAARKLETPTENQNKETE